jgi:hypothetical protein
MREHKVEGYIELIAAHGEHLAPSVAVSSSHKEEMFRVNKTSLAPTHFIAVPILRQDSERLCLCVMGYQFCICLNSDFSNGFYTCSDSVVSWFLNFFYLHTLNLLFAYVFRRKKIWRQLF